MTKVQIDSIYYIVKKKMLTFVLLGMLVYSVMATVLFIFFTDNYKLGVVLAAMGAVSGVLLYLVNIPRYFNKLNLILVLLLNLVFCPLLLMYGGINGTGPIIMAISFMLIYVLLDGAYIAFFSTLVLMFDVMLMVLIYTFGYKVHYKSSMVYVFDYFLCFIDVALVIVAIIVSQKAIYEKEKTIHDERRKLLLQASNVKGHFLASTSNDIRNPVNSIIGINELMQKDNTSELVKEEAKKIQMASYNLLSIIDDVLAYSKLEAGKLNLMPTEYNLKDVLKEVIESIAVVLSNNNINFNVRINSNMPFNLVGDEMYIRMIFMNILMIAIDNTYNGRVLLCIDYEEAENDEIIIKVQIADTSFGLSTIDIRSLFGQYKIYDSRQSSNMKGISLKYMICKELLTLMNGSIDVESIQGIGMSTNFTFRNKIVNDIPMLKLDKNEKCSILVMLVHDYMQSFWTEMLAGFHNLFVKFCNSPSYLPNILEEKKFDYIFIPYELFNQTQDVLNQYECSPYTYIIGEYNHTLEDYEGFKMIRRPVSCINLDEVFSGRWSADDYTRRMNKFNFHAPNANVLMVDDNTMALKLATTMFEQYKIDLSIATTGEECLKKVKENKYDLILLDESLPDIYGINLMESIRSLPDEDYMKIPIILLTSAKDIETRDEFVQTGFNDYMVKPINIRMLEKVLLNYLPKNLIEEYQQEDVVKNDNDASMKTNEKSGLDTSKGLLNIGFNQTAYEAILNTFYKECVKNLALLPDLKASDDLSLFTTYVHGMKSASASIGAMEVSALFKKLEFAGKESNREFIESNYIPYTEKLMEILEEVKNYLVEHNAFEGGEEQSDLEQVEEEAIRYEQLEEFKNLLDKMDLKHCDNIMENLSQRNFGKEVNAQVREMKTAYDNFDFHTVKKTLTGLMNSL